MLRAVFQDFQMTYARKEWIEERAAWRTVIFLNLIRNVNVILSHLTNEMSDIPCDADPSQEDLHAPLPPRTLSRLKFKQKHHQLLDRLSKLADIQRNLEQKLGLASFELHSTSINTAAPFDHTTSSSSSTGRTASHEFAVNSSNGWKSALDRFRTIRNKSPRHQVDNGSDAGLSPVTDYDPADETASALASCREDIKALWEDDIVSEVLNRRKVRLESAPGLWVHVLCSLPASFLLNLPSFINDADRISDRNYQPTDDDVIRARLRTLGVQEFRFILDRGIFKHSILVFLWSLITLRTRHGQWVAVVRCRRNKKQCTSRRTIESNVGMTILLCSEQLGIHTLTMVCMNRLAYNSVYIYWQCYSRCHHLPSVSLFLLILLSTSARFFFQTKYVFCMFFWQHILGPPIGLRHN